MNELKYQDLREFSLPQDFRAKNKFIVQLWWITQSTLFAMSPQVLYGWRRFLLRIFGAKIGQGVLIRSSAKFTYPWNVQIGDYCWIGEENTFYSLSRITLGNNVALAHKVYLNTGGHNYKKSTFDIFAEPIVIEDECWLTNDTYIAPGVTIGKGSIIAARSSVLKDMPSGKICAGTPAKPIKNRL